MVTRKPFAPAGTPPDGGDHLLTLPLGNLSIQDLIDGGILPGENTKLPPPPGVIAGPNGAHLPLGRAPRSIQEAQAVLDAIAARKAGTP